MVRRCLVALPLLVASAAVASDAPPPSHVAWTRAALDRVPVSKHDRTPERQETRAQQLDVFAREIARFAPTRERAALLVAIGERESHYDTEVIAGRCPPAMCDVAVIKGQRIQRARGAFQTHRLAFVTELWDAAPGNIPAQVEMASRVLSRSLTRCKAFAPYPAHVFRAYRGGAEGSCSMPLKDEQARVNAYLRAIRTPTPSKEAS